jgi:hypothetical protein
MSDNASVLTENRHPEKPGGKFQRFEGALEEGQEQIGLLVLKKQAHSECKIHISANHLFFNGFC